MRRALFVLACLAACSHGEEQVKATGADSTGQTAPTVAAASGGQRSGELTGVAEQNRAKQPVEVQNPAAAPKVAASAENIRVLALPPTQKPLVTIALRFTSGAIDDPQGKAGITALAARVMAEGGTQSLDAKSLLVALFPMATSIDARVDKELTTFAATVHRDNLEKLLPILVDVVMRPRWDPREFERLRDAAVIDVEKRLRQGDDENLGKESLYEDMYRSHPYGRLTEGHVSELRSVTLDELKAHAAKVFTVDRLTVGVAGGYPGGLPQRVAAAMAALPRGSATRQEIPQQQPQRPRFLLVEKEADASAISCGFPWALSHGDDDWPAMSIARSALGEHRQFNGRLMLRLREQRGLNYGDYAYIEHFEQAGGNAATAQLGRARHQQDFTIWIRPVQNENRLFALRAALYELSRTLDAEPFGEDEVEQTKGFLDGYILLFDQTDARKLGYALDDEFLGVRDFLRSWRSAVRGVGAHDVNTAWKKWIKPDQLQCVMVGPRMEEAKRILLSDTETPMHYQPDAQGNVPQKPPELLESDRAVNRFSFGARGDQDVVIVPVEKMFE
ncbi:MAG TPA: pitrilysin family protein [Myxococcales bacterium]|nr:pitrilysin family protein [Myxococcales bacterium]